MSGYSYSHEGGGAGPSTHDCWRCGKLFRTLNELQVHCMTQLNCAQFGQSESVVALTNRIHGGLSSVHAVPSLSNSSGRICRIGSTPAGAHAETQVIKRHECSMCDKSYTEERSLTRHVRDDHEQRTKLHCSTCSLKFQTLEGLLKHEAMDHKPGQVYRCPTCGSTFMRPDDLKAHVRQFHDKTAKFLCTKCGDLFKEKRKLSSHRTKVHDKGCTFKCNYCTKTYRNRDTIQKHVRSTHNKKKTSPADFSISRSE